MKSRITIEVNFEENNLPVIQILQQKSDDVRDNLVQAFLQSLQHTSRWCRIEYIGKFNDTEVHKWRLRPIVPQELPHEINLMQSLLPKEGVQTAFNETGQLNYRGQ